MPTQRVERISTQREGTCLQVGKISHQKPNWLALILDFWPPELRENKLCCLNSPICDSLLWLVKQPNKVAKPGWEPRLQHRPVTSELASNVLTDGDRRFDVFCISHRLQLRLQERQNYSERRTEGQKKVIPVLQELISLITSVLVI